MTEEVLTLPQFVALRVAEAGKAPAALSIQLQPAPQSPAPGLPGKQAGDVILLKQTDSQVILVSLGKAEKLSPEVFRQAGGNLVKWLRSAGAEEAGLDVAQFAAFSVQGALPAFLEGLLLGGFQFLRRKSAEEPVKTITISLQGGDSSLVERVTRIAAAVNMARDWAHEPPNVVNPVTLADRVVALARAFHLKCTVLDEKALEQLGAWAILNVGKGSPTPARLIILEYPGVNVPADAKPVVLVGKALTMDTGGYSLKGSDSIQTMKYDKCGGMVVAAALRLAADLRLATPVVGIIAAAENMVDSLAYRPDDIISTLAGKTVEIISTDAEGRLVLADALTYAQKNFTPRAIVDLATLTGGVMVALGRVRAGLMANNDELADQLFKAGERVHERLWRLPLDEEVFKLIKGDDADIKNSGGREGHTIIGGMFLKQFVEDSVPWAHLDIAAVADSPKDLPYSPKGATGFGVRLLLDYIENLS